MPTPTTKTYEQLALKEFAKNLKQDDISRIEYPDPPDSLFYMRNGDVIWVEVTAIYRNDILAKNVNTTQVDELHDENLGYADTQTDITIYQLRRAIQNKDDKQNYQPFVHQFGKGVLILYIDDPLCTGDDYSRILESIKNSELESKKFREIYLFLRPVFSERGDEEQLVSVGCNLIFQEKKIL